MRHFQQILKCLANDLIYGNDFILVLSFFLRIPKYSRSKIFTPDSLPPPRLVSKFSSPKLEKPKVSIIP